MKKLFLIDYENMHWCGGQLNCVVWAENETEAVILAEDFMEETQRELYSDEYSEDEEGYSDECSYVVNSVEEFNEQHEQWQFFQMDSQSSFYPVINSQE